MKENFKLRFENKDFLEFQESGFDLITSIGVLQKTNMSLDYFFNHAIILLKQAGQIFIDTKNINWEKFQEPNFSPEESHDWYSVQQLKDSAQRAGFHDIVVKGFIPGENKVVEPNQSHTIFLIANKA